MSIVLFNQLARLDSRHFVSTVHTLPFSLSLSFYCVCTILFAPDERAHFNFTASTGESVCAPHWCSSQVALRGLRLACSPACQPHLRRRKQLISKPPPRPPCRDHTHGLARPFCHQSIAWACKWKREAETQMSWIDSDCCEKDRHKCTQTGAEIAHQALNIHLTKLD